MNKSDSIQNIAKALHKAQAMLEPAPKTSVNPHFGNRYTDLTALWTHIKPALDVTGLSIVQTFEPCIAEKPVLNITTTLLHISGEWISGTMTLPLDKATPQAIGSATTYGRRYGAAAIIGMVSDEDDDAEGATGRTARQAKQPVGNADDLI